MAEFIGIERLTYGPWQALERAMLRFFMHCGYVDCRLVAGTGDHGADVLATKNGKLWVAQIKYRSQATALGPGVVKEVINAVNSYSAAEAVIATNQYFHHEAREAARKASSDIGVPFRLWSGHKLLEWAGDLPEYPPSCKELRAYQEEAVEAVDLARARGQRMGLVVMATGLGKTRVAGEVITRELAARPEREILVLAHRVELARQFEAALWETLPKYVSTHLWAGGEYPSYWGGVTCATEQSVIEEAKRENLQGRYSLIIVDEAHHAPADGYSKLLEILEPDFILGLTATPWRMDDRLLADIFGPPVYSMSIVEGMQQGYLAQVDYRMLVDDIDWNQVQILSEQGLTIKELNKELFVAERDEAVVNKLVEHLDSIENPRCIVFCRSIEHAKMIHRLLRAGGKPCRVIHSDLDRRESAKVLLEFRAGTNPVLISVDMLNEGIDVPDVNLVVFLRVTHSRRIFVQQLGRGLRIREGKSTVRVLDFVADIRRIAAGLQMNREAATYAQAGGQKEFLRFPDGRIVSFSNDSHLQLFDEYLSDVAQVEDLHDSARLKFPP